jgi:F-type H+-transporting ATPase subunit epsilon
MRLLIATPLKVVIYAANVVHVRGEDPSGAFGILEREEDLLTTLTLSVVSWRFRDGREGHCAVRGGVLTMSGGASVSIATREAIVGTDLDQLEHEVLRKFRQETEHETAARTGVERLHLAAIRQMISYLQPGRRVVFDTRHGPTQ